VATVNRFEAEHPELRVAADYLAKALAGVDEEELLAEFKELRRRRRPDT